MKRVPLPIALALSVAAAVAFESIATKSVSAKTFSAPVASIIDMFQAATDLRR